MTQLYGAIRSKSEHIAMQSDKLQREKNWLIKQDESILVGVCMNYIVIADK